jgi:hypothetical protein
MERWAKIVKSSIRQLSPRDILSKYVRNVMTLGEIEYKTAELFEPLERVFGYHEMSLRARVTGILSEGMSRLN